MSDLIDRMKTTKLVGDQLAIASFLTQDLHRTAFLTSAEIASECKVSNSAITRLAQKLGYAGFPELKKDLEQLYRQRVSPLDVFESFVKQSESRSVISITLAQEFENLQRLQTQMTQERVDQIVKAIAKSERVFLVGIGMAEILVDHLAQMLEVLRKPVVTLKSFGVSKRAEVTSFSSSDVVVAFSFQRILREVRDVITESKSKGAKTIAITDSESNSLALASDLSGVAPVVGVTFGMSLVAPLALVSVIANSLAALDKPRNQRILQKVKRDWENYPIFCD